MSDNANAPEPDSAGAGSEDSSQDPSNQIANLEQRLADTQRAFHDSQTQLAEVKGQVQGVMSQQTQTPVEAVKKLSEDEEFLETVRDDPAKIVEAIETLMENRESNLRKEVAGVIADRDSRFEQYVEQSDPELAEYRSEITDLKKDPAFEYLSDKQALAIVKKTSGNQSVSAPLHQSRGSISTSSSVRDKSAPKETPIQQTDVGKSILSQMGYTPEESK